MPTMVATQVARIQESEFSNWLDSNTVHVSKTGTATDFLLLEIGWLSQRFAALSVEILRWNLVRCCKSGVRGKVRDRQKAASTNWWAFCHTTKSSNLVAGVLILTPEFWLLAT